MKKVNFGVIVNGIVIKREDGQHTKSLRMLDALFGPSLLGLLSSVSPGISSSPFLTTTRLRTERSGPTMHPRTDLRLLCPCLRGLKHFESERHKEINELFFVLFFGGMTYLHQEEGERDC